MVNFRAEYTKLNREQRAAVDATEGPVLVIAGPGTGKTQLLSLRVANILRLTDINPNNILCLTYTDSGKEAILARLSQLLGSDAKKIEVHTFHGFGTRLITRFPEYFPELANFRPAEDLTLYETLYTCLAKLPRSSPLSKQAYGQFAYQTDAHERISQLKRAGILPSEALKKANSDTDWCKATGRKLTSAFNQTGRLSPKVISKLVTGLMPIASGTTQSELGSACLDELRGALKESLNSGKTAPLSSFKKKWFTSEEGKLHFKPTDQLKKLLALADLYKSYEAELKRRGLFDYDDMILFALQKLRTNPEFLATVQETFQYVLADEYQDTNAAQASIINAVAANPVQEGRPNVMVVGDDDQAIYGFQGALGDVLMDFRERWRNVKVVVLKDNYRSTRNIIDAARAVIVQGQNRLENYYEDVDKSLNTTSNKPGVSPLQFETTSPEAVIDKAVKVARSSDGGKQLAIVATKHKYLRELADRLDDAKVSYYYEGREDLLKDPNMLNLFLLADAAVAIKQKDLARTSYVLPELIASQLMPLPREVAWQAALEAKTRNKSWWESLLLLKQTEAKVVVKALKQLAASIEPKDALTSLQEIAKQWHLRITQKIRRLHEHAVAYYGHSDIGLNELLRYIELCKKAGVALEQTIVKGTDKAPVVLLSAHKSKGLEFDRVYVLHADYYTWFKERGRRNNLVLPQGWQYIEPPATNIDDRLRLLYVVMTRAKEELALIKSSGKAQTLPGLENIRIEQHISEELEALNITEEKSWRSWYLPKTNREKGDLKLLLEPTLRSYRISPTHLTTFLDVTHGGPTTFFVKILLGIPEPVHPEAIFGNYVHKTLRFAQDQLNKKSKLPNRTELTALLKREMPLTDESQVDDIVEVVHNFLKQKSVIQPGGVSEYSFTTENMELEGKPITGNVDHYVLKDSVLIITDFKTGRALNSWHVREDYYKQKLHRFRQQLMFYELLFSLHPEFHTLQSVSSKVAFVEPSRRDVYYELALDVSNSERKNLEALINVVRQKIISLDLPDVSSYSLSTQGIEDFEEDLINGKI